MRKSAWWVVFVLAVGCGDDSNNGGDGAAPGNGGKVVVKKTPEPVKPKADPALRAELEAQKATLTAKVKQLEDDLKTLLAKHKAERAEMPSAVEKRRLQQAFVEAKRSAKDAQHKADRLEKRLEELRAVAESGATGQLKILNEKKAALENERAKIYNAFKAEMAAVEHGAVDASPVLVELKALRELKHQWFKTASPARRGKVSSSAKKIINDGFRAYLREKPVRKKAVAEVLKQEGVPPTSTPDNYDYTNLDFYLLLEFREDTLARLNIVREKKALSENRGKFEKLDAQIDLIEAQIGKAMADGGDDLVEYEDLRSRYPNQKDAAAYLAERFQLISEQMSKMTSMSDVHDKAETAASDAIRAAKKELIAVTRKLKSLP